MSTYDQYTGDSCEHGHPEFDEVLEISMSGGTTRNGDAAPVVGALTAMHISVGRPRRGHVDVSGDCSPGAYGPVALLRSDAVSDPALIVSICSATFTGGGLVAQLLL
jgi:hypothetical protein